VNYCLDTGVLGRVVHSKSNNYAVSARLWLKEVVLNGGQIFIPDSCLYELERKLIQKNFQKSLRMLCELIESPAVTVLTIDHDTLSYSAVLWADLRSRGLPLCSEDRFDFDVILCAQAYFVVDSTIVTTNKAHIGQLMSAMEIGE
jgi:predicted nucleic acid-binding protein